MSRRIRAFSLIEILIALAIIALIASLVVPVVNQRRDKAAYQVSVLNLYEVAKAMEKHYLETGNYPVFNTWDDVVAQESPLREYLNDLPQTDGFGRPYRVETSTDKEYKFEGFSIEGRLKNQFPDYAYETDLKKTTAGAGQQ